MLEGILYAFGLSPVPTEIGAPFVAAILRSFASQETPSVAVLQALNEELTQGLSSDPAVSAGPQPSGHQTSETVAASALIEPPAPSPADSVIPRLSDQPAPEPSPVGQVPSLPPTMKLRLTRKGKRTAPVTATSPPPPRRQRVVSISSPTRSSDMSSTQETSLAREKASDLEVADLPLDLTAPVPIQSKLPSETDPAYVPAADLSPIFGRVDFYGDLAISWQSANRQFWESSSPLEEFDQIARSLEATCSASLSAVQRAAELQRENAVLKARLRELEPPAASSAPPEPSLGSSDAYLRAAGESAASARAISHATFDKLQQLEAALKTSESSLASEADRHQATVSELKAKEAELLSRSADLSSLQQSQELLQTGLADAQALASAAASREATMRTQWEACQATLQSLRAELSKAQEAVSQGQSDLSVTRTEVAENKNSLEAYRVGKSERLKAYRLAYVRSSFFLQKLGRWMVLLLCHGAAGGETFPSFEVDDGLFLLEAPHPAADPAPGDISAQAPPVAASEVSADPASSDIVSADPRLLPLASRDPAPSSSDVV
ncbi:translation initiation factor IF-2-like [Zingiber officinale]|uniref:translation initiation factor IF-2-like n=1 Tax=Zingiber officinale TaxID=94328 RepID=UPI001C4C364D|nr:translation initiation factor IF-2-like [Zingiber officinale]